MLSVYVKRREAVGRLRTDRNGEVSFEYVIVVCVVIAAVAAAFGGGANAGIGGALTAGLTDIANAFATALAG
jgi:hypothetical protein